MEYVVWQWWQTLQGGSAGIDRRVPLLRLSQAQVAPSQSPALGAFAGAKAYQDLRTTEEETTETKFP